jgi:hypothetical protein
MNTYLTERGFEGRVFAGPDIEAESWAKAAAKAQDIGVRVIGMLDTRYSRV